MNKEKIQTQVINGVTWTTEFPKEVGDYWFYGYRYGCRYGKLSCGQKCDPEYMAIEACKCSNGMMYVSDKHFIMYMEELGEAWFTPIVLPEFPKLLS